MASKKRVKKRAKRNATPWIERAYLRLQTKFDREAETARAVEPGLARGTEFRASTERIEHEMERLSGLHYLRGFSDGIFYAEEMLSCIDPKAKGYRSAKALLEEIKERKASER